MFKYGPACITSNRFQMSMEVLSQNTDEGDEYSEAGDWISIQDPDSFEWIRKWKPVDSSDDAGLQPYKIPCQVRGIIGNGASAAGSQEIAGKEYQNIELVKAFFPVGYYLSQNDRVTNIRDSLGKITYNNEELGGTDDFKPTIFKVVGVQPIFDFANVHTENYVLMVKAEIQ